MKKMFVYCEEMQQRRLTLGEILLSALDVFKERWGSFIALAFMVTMPASLVMQLQTKEITVTEDPMKLGAQLLTVMSWSLGLSFFLLIGTLVTAVLTQNEVSGGEKLSFSGAFYLGIRRWLHGASGLLILVLGAFMVFVSIAAVGVTVPMLLLFAIPLMIILSLYYSMMEQSIGISAALRGKALIHTLGYSQAVFSGDKKKAFLHFIGIYLIAMLPSQVLSVVASMLLAMIPDQWVAFGAAVLLDTALGLFSFYVTIGTTILYLNCEALQIRKLREKANSLHKF